LHHQNWFGPESKQSRQFCGEIDFQKLLICAIAERCVEDTQLRRPSRLKEVC